LGGCYSMKALMDRWKEQLQHLYQTSKNESIQRNFRLFFGVTWNLFLVLSLLLVVGIFFAGGVGAGYFASLVKDEPTRSYAKMQEDISNFDSTSKMYFANNVYLGKVRSDLEREEVNIEDVSPYLKNAIIATEDEYFKVHKGVVPKAVFRAIYQEFTNAPVQTGGSTITQQLVKNRVLTNEVSFERKAKEIILAMRLEKFFTKDEILQSYLNMTPLGRNSSGQNIAGVQTAAKGLFGVEAKSLSLPQAAFIAGLPQSPYAYTPFTNAGELKQNLELGLDRMKTVLFRMHREGFITNSQYQTALKYDIKKDFIKPKPSVREQYPWVTTEIEQRSEDIISIILAKKDGISENDLKKSKKLHEKYTVLAARDIRQNGYQIYSTIHKDLYDSMQDVAKNYQNYGKTYYSEVIDPETKEVKQVGQPVQTGGMMIENKTGRILSFIGGRDFKLQQLNHATQAYRSNGSTMKPLILYAPAIEFGDLAPGSPMLDAKGTFKDGSEKGWSPVNYTNGKFEGIVSARYALAKSINLPVIREYIKIHNQKPYQFLEKMGITSLTTNDFQHYSLSIGGNVTIEENTNAYTTFANGGKFVDAYMIDKIVDKNGKVIYQHQIRPEKVFSPQTAYLTLDMMRDTLKYGTGADAPSRLNFSSDWAGKSGTSQDWHDTWFIASNPNITFTTWLGYDHPRPLNTAGYDRYSLRNIVLWTKMMNASYALEPSLVAPKERFAQPTGIVSKSFCSISGLLPSSECSRAGLINTDLFNANQIPTKQDDSLITSRYVVLNGKKYAALPSTPAEFSESGVLLNPDFVEKMTGGVYEDPREVVPDDNPRWKNILVTQSKIMDDGQSPGSVRTLSSGSSLAWTNSTSEDVVGYRVYRVSGGGLQLTGSRKVDSSRSLSVGSGTYIVVSVDVAGRESGSSNAVTIGGPVIVPPVENPSGTKPKPPVPDPKPKPKPPVPDPKPTKPTDPPPAKPAP
jgi:penicillin-binding protein